MSRPVTNQYESETSADENQGFSGFDTSAASTTPSTPNEEYTDGSTPFGRRTGLSDTLTRDLLELPRPANPLGRTFDPSKDDKPLEELLARPRLPRSPYERFKDEIEKEQAERAAVNEEALKAKRASEFEEEKKALRAVMTQMSSMKLEEEKK
jgi:hypothetical protein